MISGGLWNYYRDKINDDANKNNAANKRRNSNKTITSKSFEYKTKLIGSTPDDNNILDAEVVVPLKYLSNFWRSPDLSLINCETEPVLSWSKECIITEISLIPAVPGDPDANRPVSDAAAIQATSAKFQINNAKLYVLVITLSINNNIKCLKNIKQGFKRTISWNEHMSEITTQTNNNNLAYLIDPTFRNINRLFLLSLRNGNNDPTTNSFDKYYMLLAEIKDFNALIDNKSFFDQPVKKEAKTV